MQITFLDSQTVADLPSELAKFTKIGAFTAYENTAPDQVVVRLKGADVAIVNKVVIGEKEMAELPGLRLTCIAATGRNNVDLKAAAARNILVKNVSGYSTTSIAASDVYTQEPMPADHPYLSVKEPHRLLLTPHIGWARVEARVELLAGVRENIRASL